MFDPKQNFNQTQQSPNFDPANLNSGKSFPFKKIDDKDNNSQNINTFRQVQSDLSEDKLKKLAMNKGPVEDMFEKTDKNIFAPAELEKQVNVEEENKGVVLEKEINVPTMNNPIDKNLINLEESRQDIKEEIKTENTNSDVPKEQQIKNKNKILSVLIILVVVIVVVLAGIFAYSYFTANSEENVIINDEQTNGLNDLINNLENIQEMGQENNIVEEKDEQEKIVEDEIIIENIDSDQDGLVNEREIEIGTNPNKFDTDDDGLNDFEEVEIYKTNPIISDTDGDGYLDGEEVEHGYDPLIPGSARL